MADASRPVTARQVAGFVAQTSQAIGLPLRPQDLPGVLENTARLHTLAQEFLEFPLAEEVEDAGVFQP
jgi:1-carboxybiuret hydrolase subunit AtzG-like